MHLGLHLLGFVLSPKFGLVVLQPLLEAINRGFLLEVGLVPCNACNGCLALWVLFLDLRQNPLVVKDSFKDQLPATFPHLGFLNSCNFCNRGFNSCNFCNGGFNNCNFCNRGFNNFLGHDRFSYRLSFTLLSNNSFCLMNLLYITTA